MSANTNSKKTGSTSAVSTTVVPRRSAADRRQRAGYFIAFMPAARGRPATVEATCTTARRRFVTS
jgi:hypothetical protein